MTNPFTNQDDPIQKEYLKIVSPKPRTDNVDVDEPLFATIGKHSEEHPQEGAQKPVEEAIADDTMSPHEFDDKTEGAATHAAFDHVHPSTSSHIANYVFSSARLNMGLHHIHKTAKVHEMNSVRDQDMPKFAAKQSIGIDAILDEHTSNADVVVYSGLHKSPTDIFYEHRDEHGQVPEHITMHHPAYLSTSSGLFIARQFGSGHQGTNHNFWKSHPNAKAIGDKLNASHPIRGAGSHEKGIGRHILRLNVPKGTHAISVSGGHYDENSGDAVDHEQEIILHRGHDIKIHRSPSMDRDGHYIWHGEVVGHDPMPLDKIAG